MEVKFATMNEKIEGTTCVYWRAGRCNRNPCKFMHKEIPSPHISYKSVNATYRYNGKRSDPSSKNISKYNSKTTFVQNSEDKGDGTNVVKVSKKSSRICKYWTNDNCIYGEQCLNLHSWFHGDDFSTLTKLHQHKKVLTLKPLFNVQNIF